MSQGQMDQEYMRDIDLTLGDVIRILYRRKWVLIALTVCIGVLAAAYLLMQHPTYRASGAIAVDSFGSDEGDYLIQPIRSEVLQEIAGSMRMKREVYELAAQEGALMPEQGLQSFVNTLSLKILEVENRANEQIPVLTLSAEMPDMKKSEQLANLWARHTLETVNALYETQLRSLEKVTGRARQRALENLRLAETLLTSATVQAALKTETPRLEALLEVHKKLVQTIRSSQNAVDLLQAKLAYLEERMAARSWQGRWYGEALTDALLNDPPAAQRILDAATTATRPIAELVTFAVKEEQALKRHRFDSGLAEKTKELARLQGELQNLEQLRATLKDQRRKRDALAQALENTPPVVALNKAITDDALWTGQVAGNLDRNPKLPVLRSEEQNPAHQELAKRAAELDATLLELAKRVEEIAADEEARRKRVLALIEETTSIEEDLALRDDALKRARQTLEHYAQEYRSDLASRRTIERELGDSQLDLEQARMALDNLLDELKPLHAQIETNRAHLSDLNRQAQTEKSIYDSATQRLVEVSALPQIRGESRSPSGAYLLFEAEANPIRMGSSRRRTLMMIMLLSFAALSLAFVVRDGILKVDSAD